jgi:hypothetical protein
MKRPRHVIRSQNSSDSLPMEDEHHPPTSLAERTTPSWGPFTWTHRTLSAASSLQTPIEFPHSKQNQQPQQFAISRQRPAPLQSFSFDGVSQSQQQRPRSHHRLLPLYGLHLRTISSGAEEAMVLVLLASDRLRGVAVLRVSWQTLLQTMDRPTEKGLPSMVHCCAIAVTLSPRLVLL